MTVGVDFCSKMMEIGDKVAKLGIWDTAEQKFQLTFPILMYSHQLIGNAVQRIQWW